MDEESEKIDLSSLKCKSIKDKKPKSEKKSDIPKQINNSIPTYYSEIPININSILENQISNIPTNTEIIEPKNKDHNKKSTNIDKRRLILILQFYLIEFPEKLATYKGIKFETLDVEELQTLKNEFDFIIGAKCNINGAKNLFIQGLKLLEEATLMFSPFKVEGLTNIVNDKEFEDDVKHLVLKYMTIVKTEPEWRITYKILSSMLLLHNFNSSKIINKQNIKIEEINIINSKYNNL